MGWFQPEVRSAVSGVLIACRVTLLIKSSELEEGA